MILDFKDRFELAAYLREYYNNEESALHPYYVYMMCEDGIPFYIGISKNWKRVHAHEKDLYNENHSRRKPNSLKDRKISKMHDSGKTITYKIIGWFRNHEEVYHAERSLILLYGRKIDNTGFLTNLADGGAGRTGLGTTEKQKQAARIANMGPKSAETKQRLSDSIKKTLAIRGGTFKNKKHTEATKLKMSIAQKKEEVFSKRLRGDKHYNFGKTLSEETRAKIREGQSAVDMSCSDERRQSLKDFWANQPVLTCNHCGKEMRIKAPFIKYHGDKCKHNPNKQEADPV